MCGISGYICKTNKVEAKENILKKMTDAIQHRGPDAEGQWCNNNVALGHRRLAIIDLESKSNQPMLSHDNHYAIVFNGEIYNYLELKKELQQKGARFYTDSDTEVIIEAYRYYGLECFKQFNGMWAIVLYDRCQEKIIFSRDRFGIKPLYILENENVLAFASEIKGILAAFPEENIPNENCIYRYLSSSINENSDQESFYKNIKIFPAAQYMVYDQKTQTKEVQKYWQVEEKIFYQKWIEGKNPIKTFKELFESAVELRLRADVEIGACLSGGLDSSAIVGCATKKFKKKIHTFSSIYRDRECNEEYYINKVNEKWKTIPHYMRPDDYEADFEEYNKEIIFHHDGPTNGASLYSQYMVMKKAHEHVKVVLDGQGADELFAGYIPYYSYYLADLLDRNKLTSRLKAIKVLQIVKKEWPELIDEVGTDVVVRAVGIRNSFLFQNNNTIKHGKNMRSCQLFTEEFMKELSDDYCYKDIKCSSKLNTRLCNDLMNKSIPSLLHNEDSNSMAFGIESRVPFLDYRLVEFALALNGDYKIKNQWTKWIIRKGCKQYLPKQVIKRKNKMGFPAPFSRWLREGKSKEKIKETIFAFKERNIIPAETIEMLYQRHIDGEADLSIILFKIYSMELWLRTCNSIA